ncbi:RES domain-containing protein [Lentzea sp. NPDC003310]|uniref:RES domain-containing protein n=1 Tax=Lentzea sp. NPDC003310 TaxID=3154447 RepID=UPI0033A09653
MPDHPPPPWLTGHPVREIVPAGRVFFRVHPAARDAGVFDPRHRGVFGGGRFDAGAGAAHRTLCLSAAPETAVAERFLREFAGTPGLRRILPRAALAGQVLSEVRTTAELNLVRLYSAQDLDGVHQDRWLTTAPPHRFGTTREWAAWLHDQVPWADGLLWQSAADSPRETIVLFDDRCEAPASTGEARALDAPEHLPWLAEVLEPHGVRVAPPSPTGPRFFISYRGADAEAVPELLHRELSGRFGEQAVFRDARPAPEHATAVEQAVRGCETVIALVGRHWENLTDADGVRLLDDPEDRVRRELVLAHQAEREVVPVLVGLRFSLDKGVLPPDLAHLADAPSHHLRRGCGEPDVARLVDDLAGE